MTSLPRAADPQELPRNMLSIVLNRRQLCDFELLANGAFKPLTGFMGKSDYDRVLAESRLVSNMLWPIPVVLAISRDTSEKIGFGDRVALCDAEGFMLGSLSVTDLWVPDLQAEAEVIYGTTSLQHPGVRILLQETEPVYVGGPVELLELPIHYDFASLRRAPADLRQELLRMDWNSTIAFHTSKTPHRLEHDLIIEVAESHGSPVLLRPIVGVTEPGNLEYFTRVQCCQAIVRHLPPNMAAISLLPMAMRMAGPRETLWSGIIHRNYGCSAFLVGPDDSSPLDVDTGGDRRFYKKYASQEYFANYADEIGIEMVPIEERRYSVARKAFLPVSRLQSDSELTVDYTETSLRKALAMEEKVPEWFSFPEVIHYLSKVYPSMKRIGFTIFFTGLSGSGKSTLARMVEAKLVENGQRPVTLLDGDIVRQHLSSELGFSQAHRDLNIRRIGFVANEISKNGGVAICAPIAPYKVVRREVRTLIQQYGVFVEIHLSTPLAICEERDRKGLYAKARAGEIRQFTGISDPYEQPEHAEIVIDTSISTKMQSCSQILNYLVEQGLMHSDAAVKG